MLLSHVDVHQIFTWITHYGYVALFILLALGIFGLPVPDETLITFSGFLVATHKLYLIPTLVTNFLGAACGITMSYLVGRLVGRIFIDRFGYVIGVTHEKVEKAKAWFERIGKWTLFFGYFILGVRHFTGFIAGMMRIPYTHFAVFAYAGALVWSLLFFMMGYFFSHQWKQLLHLVSIDIWYVVIFVLIALLSYLLWRHFVKRTL